MLSFLNAGLLGVFLPVVLVVAGIFLLIRCRFFLLRHPLIIVKSIFSEKGNRRSAFRAACVALSGTLGVGNIAGAASAIAVGGAGAIFWMWVFGFLAMVIKYAEVVTAMSYKREGHGGTSYYIENGLKNPFLAKLFAGMILASSFFVGNIVQSSAAAESLRVSVSCPAWVTGLFFAVLTWFLIRRGYERVSRFSAFLIPILSLGYVILSLAILWVNRHLIGHVLRMITEDAFSPAALWGGGGGFLLGRVLRYGAARGILSNEAGCGTAAYAHASAETDAVRQGFWGIVEVFVDTILLCSLTAFVVLTVMPEFSVGGMETAMEAYGVVGPWGSTFIAFSSALFALASAVSWSYYGSENLAYLGGKQKSRRLYLLLYSATGWFGAIAAPSLVWELTDLSVSVMALVNSVCLCLLSDVPAKATRRFFAERAVSDRIAKRGKRCFLFCGCQGRHVNRGIARPE